MKLSNAVSFQMFEQQRIMTFQLKFDSLTLKIKNLTFLTFNKRLKFEPYTFQKIDLNT